MEFSQRFYICKVHDLSLEVSLWVFSLIFLFPHKARCIHGFEYGKHEIHQSLSKFSQPVDLFFLFVFKLKSKIWILKVLRKSFFTFHGCLCTRRISSGGIIKCPEQPTRSDASARLHPFSTFSRGISVTASFNLKMKRASTACTSGKFV